MSKKNIKVEETVDLESRVTILEARVTVLEQSSKQVIRKKREYTDEQKAAIRARLLVGQEAASKRRNDYVKVKTVIETRKVIKSKSAPSPKQS
jgi:hypothetical protein